MRSAAAASRALAIIAAACLFASRPLPALAEPSADSGLSTYTPGHGLSLGYGFGIRAFLNFEVFKGEGRRATFAPDLLALFTMWDHDRWHVFAETDLNRFVAVDDHGQLTTDDSAGAELARLYVDYLWSEALAIRVGKFLTPIGLWNPIHEAPYLATVVDPLAATDRFFDPFATGVELFGHMPARGWTLKYALFGQPTDQLLPAPDLTDHAARRAAGGRVQLLSGGGWAVGASALGLDNQTAHRWEQVSGLDFRWEWRDCELWNEFVVNTPTRGRTTWALYTQGAVPLGHEVFGVARYEHARLAEVDVNHYLVGLNYRPWPWLVVKAEYLFSDRLALSAGEAHAPAEELGPGDRPGFSATLALIF